MPIKLVVGLGNPGEKYTGTRHNVGRLVVERLKQAPIEAEFLVTKSYMNESGHEVKRAMDYKNLSPEQVLVVLDEFQIPLRQIKILKSGSDGGHNGLNSILECLGTQDVPRMRIGIGPLQPEADSAKFVLQRFNAMEQKMINELLPHWEDAVSISITQSLEVSMNKYNGRWLA